MTDNGGLKDAELVSANWEGDGGDSRQVSSVNGQFRLAMTTLREVELGE
jgi:hypothetical protein